jgi:hypothetical protein
VVAALLIGVIFLAPLAVILAASLAQHWNGVLSTGLIFEHYAAAGSGASGDAVDRRLDRGDLAFDLFEALRVLSFQQRRGQNLAAVLSGGAVFH